MTANTRNPLLIELPTQFETERLILRVPQAGDGAQLHVAVVESLVELRRFLASLPWVQADQSVELSETYCRNAQADFIMRKGMVFLLLEKSSGQILGAAGLHRPDWTIPKMEVGYWGRASRSGEGFVTEAVTALSEYAFVHARAARLELITDEENDPSRRIAERCQFTLEGTLRHERRALDGQLRNTCIYARLAPTV